MEIKTAVPERTVPAQIIGRIVGDQANHIATAIAPGNSQHTGVITGHLLAVRADGGEYATWSYGAQEGRLVTFWGHYFPVYEDNPYEAFQKACADLEKRATNG